MQSTAKKILDRRKELNLKQKDLAGSLFTVGYISQIENGKVSAPLDTLEHIASVLKVPLSYLVDENATIDSINLNSAAVDSLLERFFVVINLFAQCRYPDIISTAETIRQNLTDSRLERFSFLCDYFVGKALFRQKKYTDAIIFLQNSADRLESCLFTEYFADCNQMIGSATFRSKRLQDAEKYFRASLKTIDIFDMELKETKSKCLINLAAIAGESNNIISAYEQYNAIVAQAASNKTSPEYIADAYLGMASCNLELGNLEEALNYNSKAFVLYDILQDIAMLAQLKLNFGHIHYRMRQFENAASNYIEAANRYAELGNLCASAVSNAMLSRTYIELNNLVEAKHYADKAMATATECGHSAALAAAHFAIAEIKISQNEKLQAITFLETAEKHYCESGKLNDLPEIYSKLGNLYFDTENYEAAKIAMNKGMALVLKK